MFLDVQCFAGSGFFTYCLNPKFFLHHTILRRFAEQQLYGTDQNQNISQRYCSGCGV